MLLHIKFNKLNFIIRHISKFDHSKYLVIIWNNKTNRMELYFNTAQNLGKSIQTGNPKVFNTSKYCLTAVNESKGLIGIYDSKDAVVSILNLRFYC